MRPWGEGPSPGGKASPSWPESRPPNPPASHRGSPPRAAPGGPTCFVGHTPSCHPPTQISTPHPYTHPSIGVSTNMHKTLRGPGHGPVTGDPREHSRPHKSTSPALTGDWGVGDTSGAGLGSLLGSHLSSSSAPGCLPGIRSAHPRLGHPPEQRREGPPAPPGSPAGQSLAGAPTVLLPVLGDVRAQRAPCPRDPYPVCPAGGLGGCLCPLPSRPSGLSDGEPARQGGDRGKRQGSPSPARTPAHTERRGKISDG